MATEDRRIPVVPVRSLAEVHDVADDDWTGLSDIQARRRRQSRLSKRAQRRRKKAEAQIQEPNGPDASSHQTNRLNESITISPLGASSFSSSSFSSSSSSSLITGSYDSYIRFPLALDHLLTLIQYNNYRATLSNLALATPAAIPSSAYLAAVDIAVDIGADALPAARPPTLTPTALQQLVPHAPWIDAVPLGRLRDNMIRAQGPYDDDALCMDLLGGLFYGPGDPVYRGVMIWADPWDIASWEVTAGFLRRWGFFLAGCPEVIEATNRWRRLRDERPFRVNVNVCGSS